MLQDKRKIEEKEKQKKKKAITHRFLMQAHLQEASEKTAGIKKNEAMTLRNHL